MNSRLILRPDLNDCILEERALPAISNFGIILLTTSGFSLVTPFPGASNSASGSLGSGGSSSTAASVSGVAIPTSFYITGTGGISSLKPGNITGNPGTAAGGPSAGGFSATIQIGSGSDSANGPTNGGATNNVVGLFTVADPTARPIFTYIGGMNTGSATTASSLSAGDPLLLVWPFNGDGRGQPIRRRFGRDERIDGPQSSARRAYPRPIQPNPWNDRPRAGVARARHADAARKQLIAATVWLHRDSSLHEHYGNCLMAHDKCRSRGGAGSGRDLGLWNGG